MEKEKGMQVINEDEYAGKFCLMIILNKERSSGMERYTDSIKYIVEAYKKILKDHPSIVLSEDEAASDPQEMKRQVKILTELCRDRGIDNIAKGKGQMQRSLFTLLVEALYRAMILVRYYAPDGDMLAELLNELYFEPVDHLDVQLCMSHHFSRATLFRRKKTALMYLGYFFYEAVLPDMEGRI